MKSGIRMRAVLLVLAATAASGCGSGSNEAVNPAAASLFVKPVAEVAGQWRGVSTLNPGGVGAFAGGPLECVGDDIATRLAATGAVTDPVALTMSQDGGNVSARLTTASAVACTYSGKAGRDSLTLDSASCQAPTVVVRCRTGEVRDLKLVGSSVSGALELSSNGNRISGTLTNTYNVFIAGKDEGVGNLVLSYSYVVNRQ